jgi:Na+/H+ antiporter NhaD/arsenite permease-like protein
MSLTTVAALAIFVATYAGMAVGRIPGLPLDRPAIALIGAALMVAAGVIPLDAALRAVDLDTLLLLLGMMIVAAELRLAGFFDLVGGWAIARAHSPLVLLAAVVAVSGVLSAFLVNDTVCLVMAPLVIAVARALGRQAVPYLLATAMAANVGSLATITGNPQNMIVGVASHLPYVAFSAALAPVAAMGLIVVFLVIAVLWWSEFRRPAQIHATLLAGVVHPPRLALAVAIAAGVVALFLAGVPVAEAALIGAAVVLLTNAGAPAAIYRAIDGPLLIMFAGLFVVVAAAARALATPDVVAAVHGLPLANAWVLTAVTAALANLVSNVPAVLMLKPFVPALPDPDRIWLIIAMAATLAGNLTPVGSIANLIVLERARAEEVAIPLWTYCRVGIPVTLVTLALGAWWLG